MSDHRHDDLENQIAALREDLDCAKARIRDLEDHLDAALKFQEAAAGIQLESIRLQKRQAREQRTGP